MRYAVSLIAVTVLFLTPAVAPAQDQANTGLAAVAPFINDQTVAVIRVDLAQIDFHNLQKRIIEPLCHTDAERTAAASMADKLSQFSQQLKAGGGSEIYLLVSMEFLPLDFRPQEQTRRPFAPLDQCVVIVLPNLKQIQQQQLQGILNDFKAPASEGYRFYTVGLGLRETKSGAMVAVDNMLDKWSSIEPHPRPEFEHALKTGGDHGICAALVPPPIFTRAAEQILRDPLPGSDKPLGPIVAHGFRWCGIGLTPNFDHFAADLVIQSDSAEAARAFDDLLKQSITAVTSGHKNEALAKEAIALLPEVAGDKLTLSMTGERTNLLKTFAQQAYTAQMAASWRNQSMNHLKQIGLAVLNYQDKYKEFPDRAIRDKNGKPLLSWRVAVLPWLEGNPLYKEFHLDEPWDSEHNRKLIDRMPEVFRSPDSNLQPGQTRSLGVVGEHCIFPPDRPIRLKEVTDGTSKTVMVIEVDPEHAVVWTKPDDLEVDMDNPKRGLFGGRAICNAGFCDGHAEGFASDINPKFLRARFTRDAGDANE